MGNIFHKRAFISRFRELMKEKGYSNNKISELVGVDRKTIQNWLNPRESTIPNAERLYTLADILNVSADYLIGRDNARHIGNKEIKDITGLSEEAIEVLRDFAAGGYSRVNIWMINYILEKYRESGEDHQITILWHLYSYIHAADLVFFGNTKTDEDIFKGIFEGKVSTAPDDNITFYDKGRLGIYRLREPEKLYQASVMAEIEKYLMEQADQYKRKAEEKQSAIDELLPDMAKSILERSEGSDSFDISTSKQSEEGSEEDQAPDDKQIKKGRKSNE